jgi:hypothetical protein
MSTAQLAAYLPAFAKNYDDQATWQGLRLLNLIFDPRHLQPRRTFRARAAAGNKASSFASLRNQAVLRPRNLEAARRSAPTTKGGEGELGQHPNENPDSDLAWDWIRNPS